MRLKDKVALVTGAASGNGKAIAVRFVSEGAKLMLADINEKGLKEVADMFCQHGYKVETICVDITQEADIKSMIATTVSIFGRLDILVNNAGIFDMLVPVGDVSDELWNKVIDINLTAPMRAIRYALPVFKTQGGGVIVNTASIAGFTGARGGGAAYVASKHGLIGLTKHTAFCYKEWNIRCNAIAPGRVDTGIRDNSEHILRIGDNKISADTEHIMQNISAGYVTNQRKADSAEIAAVALFLASDEAAFVNGSVFVADGAWTAY